MPLGQGGDLGKRLEGHRRENDFLLFLCVSLWAFRPVLCSTGRCVLYCLLVCYSLDLYKCPTSYD